MRATTKIFLLLLIGFFLTMGVIAQPSGRPGQPPSTKGSAGNQAPYDPSAAPIDPGTGIFLLLALGYGLKKIQIAKKILN